MAFLHGYRWAGSNAREVQYTDKAVLVFDDEGKYVRWNPNIRNQEAHTNSLDVLFKWFKGNEDSDTQVNDHLTFKETDIKEARISRPVKFEVRAFINEMSAADMNDDEIFTMITDAEDEIKHMNNDEIFTMITDAEDEIKRLQSIAEANRPVELKQEIDDIIEFIQQVKDYVDKR